jgi:ketosteroid isomerase-like protein
VRHPSAIGYEGHLSLAIQRQRLALNLTRSGEARVSPLWGVPGANKGNHWREGARGSKPGAAEERPAAAAAWAYPGDMNSKPAEIAREGLEAWRKGDFETIEEILDRNVEWHATEPGEWDCHSRDDVMQTLRERYEQGFAKGDLQFREGGEHAVIVVAHPSEIGGPDWPSETATVMHFRNERVVSMQDYRTEAEAIAAVEHK